MSRIQFYFLISVVLAWERTTALVPSQPRKRTAVSVTDELTAHPIGLPRNAAPDRQRSPNEVLGYMDNEASVADPSSSPVLPESIKSDAVSFTNRVIISRTDAGTLVVDILPTGLDALTAIGTGAFAIAWFSAVIPASFASGGLIMLPFWAAGSLIAKQVVVDPFVSTHLRIGAYAWSLTSTFGGKTIYHKEGATEDVQRAQVEKTITTQKDGSERVRYDLKLFTSKAKARTISSSKTPQEQEYLATVINHHLNAMKAYSKPLSHVLHARSDLDSGAGR